MQTEHVERNTLLAADNDTTEIEMGRSVAKKESAGAESTLSPAPTQTAVAKPAEKAKTLSATEQTFLDDYKKRRAEAPPVPYIELVEVTPGKFVGHSTHPAGDAIAVAAILTTTGTTSADFASQMQNDIANAVSHGGGADLALVAVNAALAGLTGIAPKDEAEAMLGAQMVAAHAVAMDMLRRTTKSTDGQTRERYSNLAIKFMRTYAMQLEALDRHRGRGRQVVRVEHVHVHEGGQAIVGNVNGKGAGGGS
ncbi:MAG: hypothetical protein WDN69_05080 [Aliidongia sp.]